MIERIALLLLALSFGACTVPPEIKVPEAKAPTPTGPPARVDLPPMVKLEGTIPPATHADGLTMRVDGLMARWQKHLKKRIRVKGYLVEKYECPKDSKICQRPHAYLHDTPAGGEKKLMVVSLPESINEALTPGEQYTITGTFDRRSGDGFIQSNGLLIFEEAEGLEVKEEEDPRRRKKPRFR